MKGEKKERARRCSGKWGKGKKKVNS